jgi:Ca2+-binding RTX toxin-like protein
MSKRTLITILAGAALAMPAGAAQAATITRDSSGTLVYTAAPGESNILDVSTAFDVHGDSDPTRVTLSDASSVTQNVQASGCVAVFPWMTTCTLESGGVRASLGDRDDRQTAAYDLPTTMPFTIDDGAGNDRLDAGQSGLSATLLGGDGNDQVSGGPGTDVLDRGAGTDDVDGAGGSDVVKGGDGNDTLHGDHCEDPAPDVIDGGPGTDTLTDDYVDRFTQEAPAVTITLAGGADDGRPGRAG